MKLRIRANSLRFRTTRSEVVKLMDTGRIEETVYFGADGQSKLTYAVESDDKAGLATLRYRPSEVVLVLPAERARAWAEGDGVGIYDAVDLGVRGTLDLIVEKDFACLDGRDVDNYDTFPNPNVGASC